MVQSPHAGVTVQNVYFEASYTSTAKKKKIPRGKKNYRITATNKK
jgi:hypothetical protein